MTDGGDQGVLRLQTQNAVSIQCVEKLLRRRYVIITGGRCGQCPILTFPDVVGVDADLPPCWVSDNEFRQLAIYLTSLPSLEEADCGFVLVIDRRQSTWSSLKTALLHISSFFPGMICACYVLRPQGFLQGTWSGINYKFFQDVIKFKVIFCFSLDELHELIDPEQLTEDLGGSIPHSHDLWITQRMGVEKFTIQSRNMSALLQHFIHQLKCTEVPRDDKVSENVLKSQSLTCNQLRNDLTSTTTTGESLLCEIRLSSVRSAGSTSYSPEKLINVTTVERLLLQLDETAHKFETYWRKHENQTRACLKKRHFDQIYNECQDELEDLTNRCLESAEIGETADAIDLQLRDLQSLHQDIQMTSVKLAELEQLSSEITPDPIRKGSSGCTNRYQVLSRTLDTIQTQSSKRKLLLSKWRSMHVKIEQADKWCSLGMELLSSQPLERVGSDSQLAERYLLQLQQLLDTAEEFSIDAESQHDLLSLGSTAQTCSLLQQVVQRFENIQSMCIQRCVLLRRTAGNKDRPVLTVMPARAEPLDKVTSKSLLSSSQKGSTDIDTTGSTAIDDLATKEPVQLSTKRAYIFTELLSTEHVYVTELREIVTGYLNELTEAERVHQLPEELCGRTTQLFGNLAEIYDFHREVMLPRIESCLSNVQAVGFCFVEQKARLFSLYTEYCLNKIGSEQLLEQLGDNQPFLLQCQQQLEHALPLSAYLLKPVQRVTKYQLLLKDLLRNTEDEESRQSLQEALSCMLDTLKCVNDSMYQIAITGFPGKLTGLGRLLIHSRFSILRESKKDVLKDLRAKPKPRHLFLYEKMLLVCKEKSTSKSRYIFKQGLQMVQVGLTESVGIDGKRFELWLPSRAAVYTIITNTSQERECWVTAIKKVLMEQLRLLKGEHCRHYSLPNYSSNKTATSDHHAPGGSFDGFSGTSAARAPGQHWNSSAETCCLTDSPQPSSVGHVNPVAGSSQLLGSDVSSDEESSCIEQERVFQGRRYRVLSDYYSTADTELSVSEGDIVYPLKSQSHGWWLVRTAGGGREGWLPSSYLQAVNKRYSYGSQSISSGELACEDNTSDHHNADTSSHNR